MESLPFELLLEICSYLQPERLFSRCPDQDDVYELGMHIPESFAAFAALCLTSRRFNNIATPQLYANVITQYPRSRSIRQLFEFMEAVIRNPSLGERVRYISHKFGANHNYNEYTRYFKGVRWLEHRRGIEEVASSIWQPELLGVWVDPFEDHAEQAQIVLLLALAPNVSRVFVDILDHVVSDIACLLGLDSQMQGSQRSRIHRFEHLEILGVVSRPARELYPQPVFEHGKHPFALILNSMQGFAKLRYYQHANAGSYDADYDPVNHLGTQFRTLDTIKLTSCNISLKLVALMVASCTTLKSFDFCVGEDAEECDFAQLHPALLKHKETLERIDLALDTFAPAPHRTVMGSFSEFCHLIC